MGQSSSREAGEEEGEVEMAWGGGDDAQNPSRRQSLYFGPPISPNGQRLNLEADVLFEGSAVPLGHLGLARMVRTQEANGHNIRLTILMRL